MADLSGKYIKGTGTYDVKEIAPITEAGELVVNGEFDTDSDWTKGAGWTINNGAAHCDGSVLGNSYLYQSSILSATTWYRFKFTISNYVSGNISLRVGSNDVIIQESANGVYEYIRKSSGDNAVYITAKNNFKGTVDNVSVQEIPEGYPLLDQGDKYLECTSAGTVAFPSDQAYGTWEWDFYKYNSPMVYFISDLVDISLSDAYRMQLKGDEKATLERRDAGAFAGAVMSTDVDYVDDKGWVSVKITRELSGLWTLYMKGGKLGDEWVLIDTTGGSGTNPNTDNTHIISNYFVIDLEAGDCIANIKMTKGVEQ